MAFPYEIVTMDPHAHSDSVSRAVLSSVYEGLVRFDPGRPIRPWLADRWDNPDHLTWRLHIRSGVFFHDGRELMAEDVVASIKRACQSQFVGHQLADIEHVRVDEFDDGMIEIATIRPSPLLLTQLEAVAIVPRDFDPGRPVGTGPYRWEIGSLSGPITLRSWARYWNTRPDFEEVSLQFATSSEELVRLLQEDGIDVATSVTVGHVREHPLKEGWQLVASPAVTTTFLALNVSSGPLANQRVRRAIDLAIDRSSLVAEVFPEGTARAAWSVIPPEIFGFSPELRHRGSDIEEARALLQEAQLPAGTVLEIVFHAAYSDVALVLADVLEDLGFTIETRTLAYDDFYRRLGESANQLSIFSWTFRVADASPFLDTIVHSRDSERGLGAFNGAVLSNSKLDGLIEAAAHESHYALRLDLLQQALRELDEERVYLPLYEPSNLALAREEYVLERSNCSIASPQNVRLRH